MTLGLTVTAAGLVPGYEYLFRSARNRRKPDEDKPAPQPAPKK